MNYTMHEYVTPCMQCVYKRSLGTHTYERGSENRIKMLVSHDMTFTNGNTLTQAKIVLRGLF